MSLVSFDRELVATEHVDLLRAKIGGKAVGLVRLLRLGCEVPPFFVVHAPPRAAAEAIPRPTGATLVEPDLAPAVASALEKLGPGPYAVRSSAVDEDGERLSYAGQFETVVGPRTLGEVMEAIAVCRRSADGERASAYRRLHGRAAEPVAVIVQRVVEAAAAGVVLSGTPESPGEVVISASWGLGEGVVQGQLPCDTWRVDEHGNVTSAVDVKHAAIRLSEGGTKEEAVPDTERARPCLDAETVAEVARTARRLAKALGRHVDLEFAVREGRVWWLQLRPVTAAVPFGRRLLWDNSNIVESFNGPTTPLTFSFASRAYTIIYQLFCRAMGVDAATMDAHASTFQRMIGRLRGRIYYNLNAWYLVLRLLPGFRFTRGWMEQMMGVAEVASDEDALSDWRPRSRLSDALRGLRAAGALIWRLVWLDRDIARFKQQFEAAYRANPREDFDRKDLFELADIYAALERRLLWTWTPPIVNDFFAMVFVGVLRKLCASWVAGPDTDSLHNDLLAAEGELASTEPTREAQRLATELRNRPALVALFRSSLTDVEVHRRAAADPWLGPELASYLERFGDRCVDELKLETESLRQRPEFLIAILRNYVASAIPDSTAALASRSSPRTDAERRAQHALRGRPLRRVIFGWVLGQARRRVKDREALRFLRTRIFGLVRDLVRAMGRRLVECGALDDVGDVFWLSLDEVFAFTRGTAITTDLRGLAALRRAEAEAHHREPAPDERFHTWGPVYAHNDFRGALRGSAALCDELRGTPCFPGQVESVARVLVDPSAGASLRGEVLVAERTDPGWIPLYPSVSGIIVERGSVLSHSAVVARELGIPTIVGVRGVTALIADGDRVRMDGATGSVRKVSA